MYHATQDTSRYRRQVAARTGGLVFHDPRGVMAVRLSELSRLLGTDDSKLVGNVRDARLFELKVEGLSLQSLREGVVGDAIALFVRVVLGHVRVRHELARRQLHVSRIVICEARGNQEGGSKKEAHVADGHGRRKSGSRECGYPFGSHK